MAHAEHQNSRQLAALANRLRLIQLDFADEGEEVRQQYLAEEVERALQGVLPDDRRAFLEGLQALFPSWDARVAVAPAAPAVEQSRTDERELQDPSFLVGRLVELAPLLSESERAGVVERLRESGLSPTSRHDWPEAATGELKSTLQAAAEADLDPVRVVEMATLLAEFTTSLDRVMWPTWKTVSPRSTVRRPAELRASLGRFAQGDQRVAYGQVHQDIDTLRKLIASLVAAVGQAGRQYAQRHLERFDPQQIHDLVPKSTFTNTDAKCWEQYKKLMQGMDHAAIEREIMQAVASYAESLMMGVGPSGGRGA